jgi:hypothetical protein
LSLNNVDSIDYAMDFLAVLSGTSLVSLRLTKSKARARAYLDREYHAVTVVKDNFVTNAGDAHENSISKISCKVIPSTSHVWRCCHQRGYIIFAAHTRNAIRKIAAP